MVERGLVQVHVQFHDQPDNEHKQWTVFTIVYFFKRGLESTHCFHIPYVYDIATQFLPKLCGWQKIIAKYRRSLVVQNKKISSCQGGQCRLSQFILSCLLAGATEYPLDVALV